MNQSDGSSPRDAAQRGCRFDAALLSAYHDSAVTDAERRAVREHVASCECCRTRLDELRRLDAEILDLPMPKYTAAYAPSFTAGVMARIRAAAPQATTVAPQAAATTSPARPVAPRRVRPTRSPRPSFGAGLGWLGATLSAAAALLLFLGSTLQQERTLPRVRTDAEVDAMSSRPVDATLVSITGQGGETVRPGKGGGGWPGPGKGAPSNDIEDANGSSQAQVMVLQEGQQLKTLDGLPGTSGCNAIALDQVEQFLEQQQKQVYPARPPAETRVLVIALDQERAQAALNFRGAGAISPALPVDAHGLARQSLATSEMIMTYFVNTAAHDGAALSSLRDTIVANGVDDQVRTAATLAPDSALTRPLDRVQALLVRLANDDPDAEPAESEDLRQIVVGQGVIEEVRQCRQWQEVTRAGNENPDNAALPGDSPRQRIQAK